MTIRKLIIATFGIISISSFSQKNIDPNINTNIKSGSVSNQKSFVGELNPEHYKAIRKLILDELKANVPENMNILIHYYQKGDNCYEYGLKDRKALAIIKNTIDISKEVSEKNNTVDFFVYSPTDLNKNRIENNNKFILDSGFLDQNIFTLKEHCRAFFILKSNGEFFKYYGFDYFTHIINFLKKT